MAAITITRGRPIDRDGYKVFRGVGAFNSTDTSGTLSIPLGNIVGFKACSVISSPTAVAYAVDGATTNGVLAHTGSITVVRSAGTDSGGKFFFEVEYDSD